MSAYQERADPKWPESSEGSNSEYRRAMTLYLSKDFALVGLPYPELWTARYAWVLWQVSLSVPAAERVLPAMHQAHVAEWL